jgi:indole-3-glycerol phosphate synthase
MILDKIVTRVKKRIIEQKQELPQALLQKDIPFPQDPFLFQKALRQPGIQIIAEIKKASPSAGVIAPDFDHVQIAKDYFAANVSAISILTEQDFFQGSLDYLRDVRKVVPLPLLRKDFMVDPYQIFQARYFGANCILLIVGILTLAEIKEFMQIANELGLDCLIEVHNEAELETALAADAAIIGINNRDLKTFKVDVNTTLKLKEKVPPGKIVVGESGIRTAEDVQMLDNGGIDAILVGETLMRAPDKPKAVRELLGRF